MPPVIARLEKEGAIPTNRRHCGNPVIASEAKQSHYLTLTEIASSFAPLIPLNDENSKIP